MYKIAICDDEDGIRNQIVSIISKNYSHKLEIYQFSDGEDLLTEISNDNYFDIILLDIVMKYKNGVEVAKTIRTHAISKDSLIIFVTSFKFDVAQIVMVHPFAYVYKENLNTELTLRIDNAISQLGSNKLIKLGMERKEIRISEKNIKYIESQRGAIIVHLTNQDIKSWSYKIEDLMSILSPLIFVRCHQSYIVNMNYAECITRKTITMQDGTIIPVSRKYAINLF